MKKRMALLATAGMLTAPLAMAQDGDVSPSTAGASAEQAVPQSGGASGLADALGVSNTALAVGAGAALAVAVGVAASSDGGSATSTATASTD